MIVLCQLEIFYFRVTRKKDFSIKFFVKSSMWPLHYLKHKSLTRPVNSEMQQFTEGPKATKKSAEGQLEMDPQSRLIVQFSIFGT